MKRSVARITLVKARVQITAIAEKDGRSVSGPGNTPICSSAGVHADGTSPVYKV